MSAAPISAAPHAAPGAAAIDPARLAKINKTAQQFEAIFVRQMLAAAHKTSFGDTMTSSHDADGFIDMQDARFADIAAQKGAFGLGAMIAKQLIHRELQTAGKPLPSATTAPGTGN